MHQWSSETFSTIQHPLAGGIEEPRVDDTAGDDRQGTDGILMSWIEGVMETENSGWNRLWKF